MSEQSVHLEYDVLIAGASFAGIEVYRRLRRTRAGRRLSVAIVDRQVEHGYIPLAHERLSTRLSDQRSVLPTARCIERDEMASYVVAEIAAIDPVTGMVSLVSGGTLQARFVILAIGSELAPPLQLPGGEHLLRYKFGHEFELARPRLRARLRAGGRLIVIGGGISGVELAGDLALAARREGVATTSIMLLEAGDRLLSGLHERVGRHALRELELQGVEVRLSTKVSMVDADALQVRQRNSENDELVSGLGIWAAGIRPNPLLARVGLPCDARGYLTVGPTLQCCPPSGAPTAAHVFGCGDAVRVISDGREWPTMQRAIECLWQAKVVAKNVLTLAGVPSRARAAARVEQPVLRQHSLVRDFPYGVSIGAASAIVYGRLVLELGGLGVWFRRFLMFMYIRRYTRMRTVARVPSVAPSK